MMKLFHRERLYTNYRRFQPTSWRVWVRHFLPRAAPAACTGLSTFKTYGLIFRAYCHTKNVK